MYNAGTVATDSILDVIRCHGTHLNPLERPSVKIKLLDGRVISGTKTTKPHDISTSGFVIEGPALQPFVDRLLSESEPFVTKIICEGQALAMIWTVEFETISDATARL